MYPLYIKCPDEPQTATESEDNTHKHTEIRLIIFEDFSCKMACISTGYNSEEINFSI